MQRLFKFREFRNVHKGSVRGAESHAIYKPLGLRVDGSVVQRTWGCTIAQVDQIWSSSGGGLSSISSISPETQAIPWNSRHDHAARKATEVDIRYSKSPACQRGRLSVVKCIVRGTHSVEFGLRGDRCPVPVYLKSDAALLLPQCPKHLNLGNSPLDTALLSSRF